MPIKTRKRILLSCFACSPIWGSEPGVGWRWLNELVKYHDVVLLTHTFFREQLEKAFSENPMAGVEVHYCSAPAFGVSPQKQLNSRIYYIWWQWCILGAVRNLSKSRRFDLVHHLTWGTFRFPTFLGRLGIPLVMGPLGGGETAPLHFYNGLPFKARAFEWIRYTSLRFVQFDPFVKWGPDAARLVLCKTHETIQALPFSIRSKCALALEIGAPVVDLHSRLVRSTDSKSFRLLFAGRLLAFKGVVLALRVLHLLSKAGYEVTMDLAGDGPLRSHIEDEIRRLGLEEKVRVLGMVSRPLLMDLYGKADLFIFPSLHDSSGNVVLESLSRGLPVVCLDLGGPKYYVTSDCGVVVPTSGKSLSEVESGMAETIGNIFDEPERLQKMSDGAVKQATIQSWESRVKSSYEIIEKALDWR